MIYKTFSSIVSEQAVPLPYHDLVDSIALRLPFP